MWNVTKWFKGKGTATPGPETLEFDPLDPAFLADPAPVYRALREGPSPTPLTSGGFLLTRASEIEAAFTDPRLGNAPSRFSVLGPRNRDRYVAAEVASHIPPFLDKPPHVPVRKALSRAFFAAFAGAEPWVRDLAGQTVADVRDQEPLDLVSGVARPFATGAMARFLGVPHAPDLILGGSAAMLRLFAPVQDRDAFEQTNAALGAARDFVRGAFADPVPGGLVAHLTEAGEIPRDQAVDCALLVLANGIENIEAAIATAVLRLSAEPEVRRQIEDGTLAPAAAVAEALRLSSPAQIIPRVALSDHTRGAHQIAEGTPVFLALGSANLDPDAHPDPEVFDPTRPDPARHVFGQGRHSCIGAPLAQLLVAECVAALLRAGVVVDIAPSKVNYQPRFGHRWPKALPVSFARQAVAR